MPSNYAAKSKHHATAVKRYHDSKFHHFYVARVEKRIPRVVRFSDARSGLLENNVWSIVERPR
jgi:hypothetical protein